jgi:hypothetical protein
VAAQGSGVSSLSTSCITFTWFLLQGGAGKGSWCRGEGNFPPEPPPPCPAIPCGCSGNHCCHSLTDREDFRCARSPGIGLEMAKPQCCSHANTLGAESRDETISPSCQETHISRVSPEGRLFLPKIPRLQPFSHAVRSCQLHKASGKIKNKN